MKVMSEHEHDVYCKFAEMNFLLPGVEPIWDQVIDHLQEVMLNINLSMVIHALCPGF